jgi:alkylation response protein AidB-like acyl-CoA dehydrogenase
MDFSPSSEQETALEAFRRVVEAEVRPVAERSRGELIPKETMQATLGKLLPFGMGNGLVREEFGGMGLSPITVGLLFEELAKASPDVAILVLLQLEAGLLLEGADEDLKQSHLVPLLRGERIASIAISEPEAGSNIAEMRCQARADGDDYVLNGEKLWISNGHYSDFCICVARVVSDAGKDEGLALFVVDRDHGYTSSNIPKMALNSQSTAQLFFDDVRVPGRNLLAPPGQGMKRLTTLLQGSRPLVGLIATAISQVALDASIRYAGERKQHGHEIAGHQLIQARIADMSVRLDAARLLIYRALDRIEKGERSELESAKAKLFATEAAIEITRHALAIHGGNGVTTEFGIENLYRIAPILSVTEGTPEIQKLIIGRALLGVSAF